MKILLNYTGKSIGITNASGRPSQVLPSHGNAYIDTEEKQYWGKSCLATVQRIKGLPSPDRNLEKLYIVNKEVAEWFGKSRKDLLVPENPLPYEGAMFYNFSKAS